MWLRDIQNLQHGTLVDVRNREEYDLNHIPGAVNIPWDIHLYYLDELQELPRPWILFCEEGYRSGLVALSLKALGFEEVYNGGSWRDAAQELDEIEAAA
ncbi:rhodanese-like domain-containing protein [Phaeodactylibacter luteus]|uniref:Rhodanese-like domain-containing protein n=1 Tax=Phaeodactylibacter luteus TaxID=1564516 RepID=A0A5C6RZP4_9BACT|nr:rhodanese-like domain-containing protein [Phaeodactylibacter luteus]TXB67567.1 rhodanese-like domain-containing protein [Phaeodactylibacter luteus]